MGVKEKPKKLTGEDVTKNIPYLTQYIVSKNDETILQKKQFNSSGDLLNGIDYSEFVTNLPLSDDLFEIPRGMKQVEAKTWEEYLELSTKR